MEINIINLKVNAKSALLGAEETVVALAAGPATIDLLSITTNNFVVLAQTAVTDANPTLTAIVGNVGLSSAAGSNITGLSCGEITGNIYDVDGAYTGGHSSNISCLLAGPGANKTLVDNAVLDKGTAYVDGNTRTPGTGATNLNVGGGTLNGQNFAPGTYTWNSNVNITGDITLTGTASDIWIFQVNGTLDLATNKQIILAGGAVNSNVFWVVTGATTIFPSSVFRGNILDQTSIAMQLGATLQGRALAQTAVTLIGNKISTTYSLVDTRAPVITLNGATSDITVGGTYTELGATAVDSVDGSFVATPSGSVNTGVVGSYIITYSAMDSHGNVATPVTRTVNVVAAAVSHRSSGGGSGGGTHYGCKDVNATNYEFFSASKPSLCVYATNIPNRSVSAVIPLITTTKITKTPLLPNTGYSPGESMSFDFVTLILNLLSIY